MKTKDIIQKVLALNLDYITPVDVQKLTGCTQEYAHLLLTRMEKDGRLKRLGHGIYVLPYQEYDIVKIALQLCQPSYISFDYVLHNAGILSQGGYTITLATLQRSRTRTLGDMRIEYISIPKKLFWGFDLQTLTAFPEKAFIDYCYLVMQKKVNPSLNTWYLENLNKDKLKKMTEQVPQKLANTVWNVVEQLKEQSEQERKYFYDNSMSV